MVASRAKLAAARSVLSTQPTNSTEQQTTTSKAEQDNNAATTSPPQQSSNENQEQAKAEVVAASSPSDLATHATSTSLSQPTGAAAKKARVLFIGDNIDQSLLKGWCQEQGQWYKSAWNIQDLVPWAANKKPTTQLSSWCADDVQEGGNWQSCSTTNMHVSTSLIFGVNSTGPYPKENGACSTA